MKTQEGGILGSDKPCNQVYDEFMNDVKGEITDYNTTYKFFLIELYLAAKSEKNADGKSYTYPSIDEPFRKAIEVMYAIQTCINEYVKNLKDKEIDCIDTFVKHVNGWSGTHPELPAIQDKQGKILMVNKKGVLESEDIKKKLGKMTFNGFLERFSERLDNIFAKEKVTKLDLYLSLLSSYDGEKYTFNDDIFIYSKAKKYFNLFGLYNFRNESLEKYSKSPEEWKNGYDIIKQLYPANDLKWFRKLWYDCKKKLSQTEKERLEEYRSFKKRLAKVNRKIIE